MTGPSSPRAAPARTELSDALADPAVADLPLFELLTGGREPLWWRCCQEAVHGQPGWLCQRDHDEALELIRDTDAPQGRFLRAGEAVSWISKALVLVGPPPGHPAGQPADAMQRLAARAAACWADSPAMPSPVTPDAAMPGLQTPGPGDRPAFQLGNALAQVHPAQRDRAAEVLACLDRLQQDGGQAMAAITALLLAGTGREARRGVRVRVVLARRSVPEQDKPVKVTGVAGWLQLRELPAGPAGLFPDPVAMQIPHGTPAFRESLRLAWQYAAGGKPAGRCVLWRLAFRGSAPDLSIDGGSLGAAFAIGLHELALRTAAWSSPLARTRTFLIGIRPNCAITGLLTSQRPAGYELARRPGTGPWLGAVEDMDAKTRAASDQGLHLIAPAANQGSQDASSVHWARTVRQADRYARRPRPLRTAVAASVVVALASTAFAISASGGGTRTILHRIRQTVTVRQLPTIAPGLLTSNTSLGVLTGIAAYEQHATPASAGNLAAAASQPLVDSIPAPQSPISSIAFSPDGKTLASGFDSGVLTQNLATGKTVFPGWAAKLGAGIQDVAYSPDGSLLAGGDFDGQVFFADPATGAMRIGYSDGQLPVDTVAFSPDGQSLASAGKGQIDLWNPATSSDDVWQEHGTVNTVAFSPDGQSLAAGDSDGKVTIHAVPTGTTTATISAGSSVASVAYSPAGRDIAIGAADGKVIIRDLVTGATTVLIAGGSVICLAYSRDGQTLAIGDSDGTLFLYDPATGATASLGTGSSVSAIAFSPGGGLLATANATQLDIWNPGGAFTPRFDTTSQVSGIAFSPDSGALAAADADGQITLHSLTTGSVRSFYDTSPATGVAFSPDGRLLASGDNTGTVVFTLNTGARHVYDFDYSEPVPSIAFSPAGQLAIGDAGNFLILNPATGHAAGGFSVQGGTVSALAYSPDGRLLAGAVNGVLGGHYKNLSARTPVGGISFFNPHTGEQGGASPALPDLMPFAGSPVNSLAFSPDSTVLAGGQANGRVVLHNLKTGAATTFDDHSPVDSVAFSPDGHILASGTADGHLVLRNLRTGTQVTLDETGGVTSLAFSPDGRLLAAGGIDGQVNLYRSVLWSSTLASLKNRLCKEVGNINLTPAQWKKEFPRSPYRKICP